MVSVFFCCHNLGMDTEKLWNKILENDDIKKIPLKDVIKVVIAVFDIINSGDCFYDNG